MLCRIVRGGLETAPYRRGHCEHTQTRLSLDALLEELGSARVVAAVAVLRCPGEFHLELYLSSDSTQNLWYPTLSPELQPVHFIATG
jgi:hypothetical protein